VKSCELNKKKEILLNSESGPLGQLITNYKLALENKKKKLAGKFIKKSP
jgi:hypothetical protein